MGDIVKDIYIISLVTSTVIAREVNRFIPNLPEYIYCVCARSPDDPLCVAERAIK